MDEQGGPCYSLFWCSDFPRFEPHSNWLLCPFITSHHSISTSLHSGKRRCHRLKLYFHAPDLESVISTRTPFSGEKDFRYQDLGIRYSLLLVLLMDKAREYIKVSHSHLDFCTHTHIYIHKIHIFVSTSLYSIPLVHINPCNPNPTYNAHSSFSFFYICNSLLQQWETWLSSPSMYSPIAQFHCTRSSNASQALPCLAAFLLWTPATFHARTCIIL